MLIDFNSFLLHFRRKQFYYKTKYYKDEEARMADMNRRVKMDFACEGTAKAFHNIEQFFNSEQPEFLYGEKLVHEFEDKYPEPLPI